MIEEEYKQRVLIVHNYYQISGGEDTVVENEKEMLEANGHLVYLYTRHNNEIKGMSLFRKMLLPFSSIFSIKTYRDVCKIIKLHKIDVVHVHNTLTLISPSVYYAAIKMKKPVVQTIHNFRFLCPGATFYRDGHICEDCVNKGLVCAVRNKCYRGSKTQTLICVLNTVFHRHTGILKKVNYICLTEFNKNKLTQNEIIRDAKVYIKPNFVCESTEVIPYEKRSGFCYIGRLDELKGIKILFEAWKIMGKDAPKLTICGTGPLEEWCIEQARSLNVEIRGFLSHEKVMDLLSLSKALIFPSLWYEGFPMGIVEAFSVGTPVVCSDLGNAGGIVKENENGWKFSPGDSKALIEAISRCRDISDDIYELFKKSYSLDQNYNILQSIYRSIS